VVRHKGLYIAKLAAVSSMAALLGCLPVPRLEPHTAGIWFERNLTLPSDVADTLGGPLTVDELDTIARLAQREIAAAFSELDVRITSERRAFWRVEVVQTLPPKRARPLPSAGESLALGPLGGTGAVDFAVVARRAVRYAPPASSRETVVAGIGRGIGRVAVHEFAHQMLGAFAPHNEGDQASYEYPSPDRAAQYYGDLHWSTAWPLLKDKFGRQQR
jgi:hypothetical protein